MSAASDCPSARAEVSSPPVPEVVGFAMTSGEGPARSQSGSSSTSLQATSAVQEAWSAANENGGLISTPGHPVGSAKRICRPSEVVAPPITTSATQAAVTQGIKPLTRNRPGPTSSARTAWSPCRRDVVSCEIPTVGKARPASIFWSHAREIGRSNAANNRRTAASCCDRMKAAVIDPSATLA